MSPSSPAHFKACRSSASASLRLEEERKVPGIGSILGFSEEKQRTPQRRDSLRRTLSADMSSRKWLAQMGSPEEKGKPQREEIEPPKQLDLWSSILSQNAGCGSTSPTSAPYVHPLVRRSARMLSEKSLEVCTESLGSETGSDGFSSSSEDFDYSSPSDVSEDEEEETEQEEVRLPYTNQRELAAVNYNCSVSRRSPPRSFPPPLPSISRRDGPCLQMRSHRKDGRLVLQAVPVTSQNYLHAERDGGRLRLTFVNAVTRSSSNKWHVFQPNCVEPHETEEEDIEEKEQTLERESQEEEIEEAAYVDRGVDIPEVKFRAKELCSREMKVHRAAEMMNKFIGVSIKNPNPWNDKKSEKEDMAIRWLARSSPASAMLNTYECWWRSEAVSVSSEKARPSSPKKLPPLPKKPVVINAEELLKVRRCKEAGRPPVVWVPRCIATS